MVGVAARSKGCNTCRKRKIACGLQRPQCAQCTKSRRICTGYMRDKIFLVNTDKSVLAGTATDLAAGEGERPRDLRSDSRTVCKRRYYDVPTWKKQHTAHLPKYMSLVPAYRQSLLDRFVRSKVPFDYVGSRENRFWLESLAELAGHPPVLTTAIFAVSLSKIGRERCSEALVHESLKQYTDGLWELQKALWDPDQMYTSETLAACLLLSFYELCECPAGSRYGYIYHQDGCARLVQMRGPEACQRDFGHDTFLAFRSQCIMQALDRHQPTFLAQPEWMEVPWTVKPKSHVERMWDFIAKAPAIFHRTDNFDNVNPAQILCTAIEIIEECFQMDADLEDLLNELKESTAGPLYWPELSVMHNDADNAVDGKVFPVAFHFFNLRMATVLLPYWATLTMMYNGVNLLYGVLASVPADRKSVASLEDPPALLLAGVPPSCPFGCPCGGDNDTPCIVRFDMSKLPLRQHREDFMSPARHVCQSVEYCLQEHMLDLGPGIVTAPLAIVLGTIEKYPFAQRESAWMRNVLKRIEEQWFPYLKYVQK